MAFGPCPILLSGCFLIGVICVICGLVVGEGLARHSEEDLFNEQHRFQNPKSDIQIGLSNGFMLKSVKSAQSADMNY